MTKISWGISLKKLGMAHTMNHLGSLPHLCCRLACQLYHMSSRFVLQRAPGKFQSLLVLYNTALCIALIRQVLSEVVLVLGIFRHEGGSLAGKWSLRYDGENDVASESGVEGDDGCNKKIVNSGPDCLFLTIPKKDTVVSRWLNVVERLKRTNQIVSFGRS